MVFAPHNKCRVVCNSFPNFVLDGQPLQFVSEFHYLGHIITNSLCYDADIHREIRNLYYRTNTLVCIFGKCSRKVKIRLFRTYCICFYGAALWKYHTASVINKFKSCYNKCMKMFFNYPKMHCVAAILLVLKLPSFDTVVHNYKYSFYTHWTGSVNSVVQYLSSVGCMYYV